MVVQTKAKVSTAAEKGGCHLCTRSKARKEGKERAGTTKKGEGGDSSNRLTREAAFWVSTAKDKGRLGGGDLKVRKTPALSLLKSLLGPFHCRSRILASSLDRIRLRRGLLGPIAAVARQGPK